MLCEKNKILNKLLSQKLKKKFFSVLFNVTLRTKNSFSSFH